MGCRRQGFTLVELAVTLVLAGLFAGLLLKVNDFTKKTDCVAVTQKQLGEIRDAMAVYVNGHDRFPLPAQRTLGIEDPNYGREVDSATLATLDSVGGATYGALPFQALGLASSYASDCWGNKLTYVVTTDLTDAARFTSTAPIYSGTIRMQSEPGTTINTSVAYAVISHGANASGAVASNYSGTDKHWCTLSTARESENCEVSNATLMAAEFNDGKDANGSFFDDVIVFSSKNPRAIDGVCGAALNTCSAGTLANIAAGACGDFDRWNCLGINGGVDANCQQPTSPCPINGACGAAHGSSYPAGSPPAGAILCSAGTATGVVTTATHDWSCNGSFGGTNIACQAAVGAAVPPGGGCATPWGAVVPEGSSVTAYQTNTSNNCPMDSETRTCISGVLSGTYPHGACAPLGDCVAPWAVIVPNGSSIVGYTANSAANCITVQETRTCTAGVLSGSATFGSCTPTAAVPTDYGCGGGAGVSAPLAPCTVNNDFDCPSTHRIMCTSNGSACGSWLSCSCVPDASCSAPSTSCTLPWGAPLADGASTTGYHLPTFQDCSWITVTYTCNAGTLNSTSPVLAEYPSCSSTGTSDCALPWGGTLTNGSSVPACSSATCATGYCGTQSCNTGGLMEPALVHPSCS